MTDLEKTWSLKNNQELIQARNSLSQFGGEEAEIIRSELRSRDLKSSHRIWRSFNQGIHIPRRLWLVLVAMVAIVPILSALGSEDPALALSAVTTFFAKAGVAWLAWRIMKNSW